MGVVGFLVTRFVTVGIVFIAITIGWFAQCHLPLGRFFATVIPLYKGIMPPTIVGHGKMSGTPPVPDDLQPQPRPSQELFLTLSGSSNDTGKGKMPANGLGLCCRPTAYDDVLVRRTVLWYLLQGGRHLDGADLYLNHVAVGQGIADAMARGIPRSEIFVTTKIFPNHYGYNRTLDTIPRLVQELGLDYIDLILMHFPGAIPVVVPNDCTRTGKNATICRQETWLALSEMRRQRLVRHVGVSNFAQRHLQDIQTLLENDKDNILAPIANNQIQYSPFAPQASRELVEYCHAHNISVTAYSPLGGLADIDKAMAVQALQEIASHYTNPTVTVSQVLLRWALQKGLAVIPGTGNPNHMRENLAIYDFTLTEADMQALDGLQYQAESEKFFFMDIAQMA